MRRLSLDNFKQWMDHHKDEHLIDKEQIVENRLIGVDVQPKINSDRLIKKIIPENDQLLEQLVEDFVEYNGTITAINENRFVIKTKSGTFELHKCYVKRT